MHNRCVVLQLPTKLQFEYHRYGRLQCRSEVLDSNGGLDKTAKIGMESVESGSHSYFLEFEGRWGYNLSTHGELAMLAEAQ